MKKRTITSIVLLILTALFIACIYTVLPMLVLAAFSAIAVYEVATCAQVKNKATIALGSAFAFAYPIVMTSSWCEGIRAHVPMTVVAVFYVLLMLIVMLIGYDITKFEHVAIVMVASVFIPFGLTAVLRFRDIYMQFPQRFVKQDGVYIILFAAICAFATDSGAYLAGKLFGKHKMAPKISPKKTVEGAVGGVVLCVVLNVIALLIFQKITNHIPFPYWQMILISIFLSVLGMMGDLTASVIKRNYDVKDYGKIFPGHGGIMDRFDSALFVFSALYAILFLIA